MCNTQFVEFLKSGNVEVTGKKVEDHDYRLIRTQIAPFLERILYATGFKWDNAEFPAFNFPKYETLGLYASNTSKFFVLNTYYFNVISGLNAPVEESGIEFIDAVGDYNELDMIFSAALEKISKAAIEITKHECTAEIKAVNNIPAYIPKMATEQYWEKATEPCFKTPTLENSWVSTYRESTEVKNHIVWLYATAENDDWESECARELMGKYPEYKQRIIEHLAVKAKISEVLAALNALPGTAILPQTRSIRDAIKECGGKKVKVCFVGLDKKTYETEVASSAFLRVPDRVGHFDANWMYIVPEREADRVAELLGKEYFEVKDIVSISFRKKGIWKP